MKKFILTLFLQLTIVGCHDDLCDDKLCQNGGYCDDGTCICPCGYTGTNCDLIVPSCGSIPTNSTIFPIIQQNQMWCWISCGEMILRYYDIPQVNPLSYQCGIIGSLYPECYNNCSTCANVGGDIQDVQWMLKTYASFACPKNSCPNLKSTIYYSFLSIPILISEIDNKRPVLAGISASGQSLPSHAVLIVGYFYNNGDIWISVNDPWPYDPFSAPNPYFANGGYEVINGNYCIPYFNFLNGLTWTQSLYEISI